MEYCLLTDIEYLCNIAQRCYCKYVFLFICGKFAYAANKSFRDGYFLVDASYIASATQKDRFAECNARKETLFDEKRYSL